MKSIRQGWKVLSQNRRAGVSLILAMCAAALLLGLSMSLLYSASMPMARADQKIQQERCYQLARTFAQVLEKELMAYGSKEEATAAQENSFYVYANDVLEGVYGEYDAETPELSTFYFSDSDAGSATDDYGKITVALRKRVTQEEGDEIRNGSFHYTDSKKSTEDIEAQTFIQYLFYVDVTAQLDDVRYTYTTEYYRMSKFTPTYTLDGKRIFYDGDQDMWYEENPHMTPIDFTSLDSSGNISYTYNENEVVSKRFEPVYKVNEKGGEEP